MTDVTASADFPLVRSLQLFKGTTDDSLRNCPSTEKVWSIRRCWGINFQPDTGNPFSSGGALAYLNGNAYVVGRTNTTDSPITSGAYPCCGVNTVWDGTAAFIAKLADDTTSGNPARNGGTERFTPVELNASTVPFMRMWYTNTGSLSRGASAVR